MKLLQITLRKLLRLMSKPKPRYYYTTNYGGLFDSYGGAVNYLLVGRQ